MFITIEDETGVANLVIWPDPRASASRDPRLEHDGGEGSGAARLEPQSVPGGRVGDAGAGGRA